MGEHQNVIHLIKILDSSFKVSTMCLTIMYRAPNCLHYVVISDIISTFYEYQ